MPATSEKGSTVELASGAKPEWLGNSVWQSPKIEISRIKSWASIAAFTYHRAGGESIWRGDRHRMVLVPDQAPSALLQIDQGPTRQVPLVRPGSLAFYPAGL